MLKQIGAIALGGFALYLRPILGIYPLIAMMVLIELFSSSKNNKSVDISFIVGMFISEAYLLYTGADLIEIKYFIYVGVYLLLRYKGNDWFFDNKVNGYFYLLFGVSMPIFLEFITRLVDKKMDLLLYAALYLAFLRMSDLLLKTKFAKVLFAVTQIVAAYKLDNFIIHDQMRVYFVAGMILWAIMKLEIGGKTNVPRVFTRRIFGESSKRIY